LHIHHRKLQSEIDSIIVKDKVLTPRTCTLAFDTTFFGQLSVSLIRDVTNRENLIWRFGSSETKECYEQMYAKLLQANIIPIAIVVDGRSYFFEIFGDVPVQMCQFHMGKILARYLTRRPNLEVNKALWKVWYLRAEYNSKSFGYLLQSWYFKYKKELEEVSEDQNGRRYYVKERTKSAYFSLIRFLPWLFTYQKSKWIPTTNNSIEGLFGDLKKKINIHPGLSVGRKMKIIHELLK